MSKSFGITADVASAMAGLDGIAVAADANARPAAQAGAQVFYEEVLMRVPVDTKPRKLKSGSTSVPGALKRSIYQVFSKSNSRKGFATYHISWNHIKAPHGHLVENGTSRAPAHSFIRSSYDAAGPRAGEAMRVKWCDTMRATVAGVS